MLTPAERGDVEGELAAVLAEQADPRAFLTIVFGPAATPLLQELPTTFSRAQEFAAFTLNFCLRKRWSSDPSMLELLLTRLIDSHGRGALGGLRTRVRGKVDPNPDLFVSNWILGAQPFFDRQDLRGCARKLLEENDRPLLRVNGPAGSGRSYTSRFFDFIMDRDPRDLHVVTVEVSADTGPSYTVEELAESLIAPMGVTESLPARTVSSYPGALGRWILRHAMRQQGLWIFILDGFGQRDVKPEVKELIQLLAAHVSTGEYRRRLRVILIDNRDVIPRVMPADMMDEEIRDATQVSRDEIIECLLAHNVRMRELNRREIEATALGTIADDILHRAPAKGKARLRFVYDELLALTVMPD